MNWIMVCWQWALKTTKGRKYGRENHWDDLFHPVKTHVCFERRNHVNDWLSCTGFPSSQERVLGILFFLRKNVLWHRRQGRKHLLIRAQMEHTLACQRRTVALWKSSRSWWPWEVVKAIRSCKMTIGLAECLKFVDDYGPLLWTVRLLLSLAKPLLTSESIPSFAIVSKVFFTSKQWNDF